jgi:uncharacterized protein YuzE
MSEEIGIDLDERRSIYEVHIWRRTSGKLIASNDHFREVASAILKLENVVAVQVSDESGIGKFLFKQ